MAMGFLALALLLSSVSLFAYGVAWCEWRIFVHFGVGAWPKE